MKILVLVIFLSLGILADSKSKKHGNHEHHHDNNALKANAINSPVPGNTLKVEIFPPKNYKIKEVFYVLYGKNGKPYWHPLAWKKAKLISNTSTTIAEITFSLEAGPYKAFLLAVPENKKSENRKTWISFSVAKLTEVPDPGEEGMLTLQGIDSDNDGVRDDVQRWINQRFPTSSNINKALRQLTKYEQLAIINHTDKEKAVSYHVKSLEAYECLNAQMNDLNASIKLNKEYDGNFLNTPERINASLKVNSYRHGESGPPQLDIPMAERIKFCEF